MESSLSPSTRGRGTWVLLGAGCLSRGPYSSPWPLRDRWRQGPTARPRTGFPWRYRTITRFCCEMEGGLEEVCRPSKMPRTLRPPPGPSNGGPGVAFLPAKKRNRQKKKEVVASSVSPPHDVLLPTPDCGVPPVAAPTSSSLSPTRCSSSYSQLWGYDRAGLCSRDTDPARSWRWQGLVSPSCLPGTRKTAAEEEGARGFLSLSPTRPPSSILLIVGFHLCLPRLLQSLPHTMFVFLLPIVGLRSGVRLW